MARKGYTTRNANRAIERLREEALRRALHIGQEIVQTIALDPETPYDNKSKRGREKSPSQHLRNSYYARVDPGTGDVVIKSRSRYWAFVEYGTRRRNYTDRQPHVRDAIDIVKARYLG